MTVAPGPGTGHRSLRADRRRMALLLVGVVAVAAVTAWVFLRAASDDGVGPSPLHYTLLTTNLLLIFGLVVSVARYFIRLLSERRAGILGSRFKFKLVLSFIGLCLVPVVVLQVAALAILFTAVDATLGPEVDSIIEDAQAHTNQFLEAEQTRVARQLRELVDGLGRGVLVTPEHSDDLRARLELELGQRGLAAARLHFRGRSEALDVQSPHFASRHRPSPLDPVNLVPGAFERDLSTVLGGGAYAPRRWHREGELFLVAAAPVLAPGHDEPAAALFVAQAVPAELRAGVNRLTALRQQHVRLRAQVPWLKAEHALLFMGFSLFTILGATWVGLYMARSITLPIQRLAEGTVEVRRGHLEHRVDWRGNDELAVLVEAFNDMARDLGAKAREVERTTGELARRRDEVAQLLEALTAGVLVVGGDGTVRVANRAARELLRLPASLPSGQDAGELLSAPALAELREAVEAGLGRPHVRVSRELVLEHDTGPVHAHVVLTELVGGTGEREGLLLVLEDVTELVRAQRLATWRTVARRIAHEIKNPLTPIQLAAQRIRKKYREQAEDLPEALEGGVATIVEEVRGLKQMVNEFSEFARMPEHAPTVGDLNALMSSVVDLYRGHEGARLELATDDDLPRFAFDAELLRRALGNLVDNAVEATGGQGRVRLRSSRPPGRRCVRIDVEDDGPGIPVADRERLFLPYFTTKRDGTGLGLAIVNRIVTDHGGRVGVEDREPRGTRFFVELPLTGAAGPAAAVGSATRPAEREGERE